MVYYECIDIARTNDNVVGKEDRNQLNYCQQFVGMVDNVQHENGNEFVECGVTIWKSGKSPDMKKSILRFAYTHTHTAVSVQLITILIYD